MTKGRARIVVGQGVSAWVLEAREGFGDAGLHSHHAIQITVCLEGELTLAASGRLVSGTAIAVAADARHRLEARGLIALIFVEPESAVGRTLAAKLLKESELASVDHPGFLRAVEGFRGVLDRPDGPDAMLAVARQAVGELAPVTCLRGPDERVQRIIAHAVAHLDEPLTLEGAAQGIYLSASRLRHLFVEQTGLAFRTYLLWLRLVRAVQLYSEGRSLTECAHAAGFADSPHFSRVFKRTFGLPATTLTRL